MSDIDNLIYDINTSDEIRKSAERVRALEDTLTSVGIDPGQAEPRENLFSKVLDFIDTPTQGIQGVINTALRGDMFEPGVGTGFIRGTEENTNAWDILREHDIIENPIARAVVGFGAQMLTDPLTYLAPGSSFAKGVVGGKALTEAGAQLSIKAVQRSGLQGLEAAEKLDTAFSAAGKIVESQKMLSKAKSVADKEAIQSLILEQSKNLNGLIDITEVTPDLFKSGISLGIDAPFLGYLTKGKNSKVLPSTVSAGEDAVVNPIRSLMGQIGDAINPGKVELVNFANDSKLFQVAEAANSIAKESLVKLGDTIATAIPAAGKAGNAAKDVITKASNGFKSIFSRKLLVGEKAADTMRDFQGVRAANGRRAEEQVLNTFTREELDDVIAHKNVIAAIDEAVAQSAKQLSPQQSKDLLNEINTLMQTGAVTPETIHKFANLFQGTQDPDLAKIVIGQLGRTGATPIEQSVALKSLNLMKETYLEEQKAGLSKNFLSIYLPRMYANAGEAAIKAGKPRLFSTLDDALKRRGLLTREDLPKMLAERIQSSLNELASRNFSNRLHYENSLPPDLVEKLYREAVLNPQSASAEILKAHKFSVSSRDFQKFAKEADIGNLQTARRELRAAAAAGDAEAARLIHLSEDDFAEAVHKMALANGKKPFDSHIPQSWRNEYGEVVTMPSGEELIMPKPIADAWKEINANKDMLKSNKFLAPIANFADTFNSFTKFWVTRPFPAYHANNWIGDMFFQAMNGASAMNPGIAVRAINLANGRGVIQQKNGITLTANEVMDFLKKNDPSFSIRDHNAVYEAAQELDPILQAKKNDGFIKNFKEAGKALKEGKVVDAASRAAYGILSAGQKLEKAFPVTFRFQHYIHRLEQGDTPAMALKSAREAFLDYGNLSQVEKDIFRRTFLFYGFMSQATKKTFNDLIRKPGNITLQQHGVGAIAELFSRPDAAPSFTEQDARVAHSMVVNEQLSRFIGRGESGNPIFARFGAMPLNSVMQNFSLEMPKTLSVGEVMSAGLDSAQRSAQKITAQSNPIFNTMAQFVTGKNLYFDRPVNSKFLRTLPSLNAAASKLTGVPYDQLPLDLDAPIREWLKAEPNGKGGLVADYGRYFLLLNLVPAIPRAISTVNSVSNTDFSLKQSLLRQATGVNLDDSDPSRGYLAKRRENLDEIIRNQSVYLRKKNMGE